MSAPDVPGLPAGHEAHRQSKGETAAILAVVHEADIAVLGHPDFTADDVEEVFSAPHCDVDEDTWVVTDPAGAVCGWAYIDSRWAGARQECDVYVAPSADPAVRTALLRAVVARGAERAREAGREEVTLDFGVVLGDDGWADALRAEGFEPRRRFNRMRVELDGPRPYPTPPPGVSVRDFDPTSDDDWRDWHAVNQASFADHWGSQTSTLEDFRAAVEAEAAPGYADWAFADCDGRPVGHAQCPAQFAADGGGWVRALGVLPEYRGRGIARFLLEHSLARFAEHGWTWAGLGVDTGNATGALRLYESLGMHPEFQIDAYQREVAAAPGG